MIKKEGSLKCGKAASNGIKVLYGISDGLPSGFTAAS